MANDSEFCTSVELMILIGAAFAVGAGLNGPGFSIAFGDELFAGDSSLNEPIHNSLGTFLGQPEVGVPVAA